MGKYSGPGWMANINWTLFFISGMAIGVLARRRKVFGSGYETARRAVRKANRIAQRREEIAETPVRALERREKIF